MKSERRRRRRRQRPAMSEYEAERNAQEVTDAAEALI